jgi:hypothetical protein
MRREHLAGMMLGLLLGAWSISLGSPDFFTPKHAQLLSDTLVSR